MAALQRDHPVAPERLQHPIHVDARQPESFGQIRLGQRQVEPTVRGLADRSQALQQFAQKMSRALDARANADIGDPLAPRCLLGEPCALQGERDAGMVFDQIEIGCAGDAGDPAMAQRLDGVVERVSVERSPVAEIAGDEIGQDLASTGCATLMPASESCKDDERVVGRAILLDEYDMPPDRARVDGQSRKCRPILLREWAECVELACQGTTEHASIRRRGSVPRDAIGIGPLAIEFDDGDDRLHGTPSRMPLNSCVRINEVHPSSSLGIPPATPVPLPALDVL